jgi:hypothetical protein
MGKKMRDSGDGWLVVVLHSSHGRSCSLHESMPGLTDPDDKKDCRFNQTAKHADITLPFISHWAVTSSNLQMLLSQEGFRFRGPGASGSIGWGSSQKIQK